MGTGHFLKMLNDASLASLGFLMWNVLGCIICKTPLWVLSCKVNPLRCQTIVALPEKPFTSRPLAGVPSWHFLRGHSQVALLQGCPRGIY